MPTNTPAFSPIIATPSPVKNDVPIVQDAAGTYPRRKPTLQLPVSITESCSAFHCDQASLCLFSKWKDDKKHGKEEKSYVRIKDNFT